MDEPSQTAREALRRYQAAAGLSPPARARVWRAIEGSLDAAPEPVVVRRRGRVGVMVFAGVLAAAVVVAVCDLRERIAGSARVELDAAGYAVEPDDARVPAVRAIPEAEVSVAPTRARARAIEGAPAPGLAAEMALLRQARAALDEGDAAAALRALDEHARSFVSGQMAEDRLRLRIEALCAAGERAAARAEAAAFLQARPESPHASRVRNLCRDP